MQGLGFEGFRGFRGFRVEGLGLTSSPIVSAVVPDMSLDSETVGLSRASARALTRRVLLH